MSHTPYQTISFHTGTALQFETIQFLNNQLEYVFLN